MPDSRTVTAPTSLATSVMSASLADVDPDIAELLDKELGRQRDAGDDRVGEFRAPLGAAGPGQHPDQQVRRGLPGRRYYGGCEYVDAIENIARDRAKALFGAEFANVQPHSGAQANAAVLAALMAPGNGCWVLTWPTAVI